LSLLGAGDVVRIGLAILAAVAWGSSTVLAGGVARKASIMSLTFWSQILGLAVAWPVLFIAGSKVVNLHILGLGALAGIGVGAGLILLYLSTRYIFVGVASAVSAVIACAGPVLFSSINHPLTAQGLIGLFVCLAAISMVARWRTQTTAYLAMVDLAAVGIEPTSKLSKELTGVLFASLSGLGMGVYYWALAGTNVHAQLWEALDSRVVSSIVILIVAVCFSSESIGVTKTEIKAAAPVAALGIIGALAYATSVSASSLSVVVPISSLSPIVTVMLGWIVLKERASRTQLIALTLAMVGVVLLSA
jgi:drug/metabolite transporter (DMT)-like permease